MGLMQDSIDLGAIGGLLVAAIGIVAATIGVIAAAKATHDARGSPARTDREILPVLAERLSMNVSAQGKMNEPLVLRFTLDEPAITLLRIEVANQLDHGAGTAQCVEAAPRVFVAAVEPKVVQRWYNANPYWDGETKLLPICVFFRAEGQAACRTIWVKVNPGKLPSSGRADASNFAWFLNGRC
jgi:hypothetical protein